MPSFKTNILKKQFTELLTTCNIQTEPEKVLTFLKKAKDNAPDDFLDFLLFDTRIFVFLCDYKQKLMDTKDGLAQVGVDSEDEEIDTQEKFNAVYDKLEQTSELVEEYITQIKNNHKKINDQISSNEEFRKRWDTIATLTEKDIWSILCGNHTINAKYCIEIFKILEENGLPYDIINYDDGEQAIFWTGETRTKTAIKTHQMAGEKIIADIDIPALNHCFGLAKDQFSSKTLGLTSSDQQHHLFSNPQYKTYIMFLSVSFAMLAKKSPIYFTRAPRHTEEDAIPVGSWFWECELPMLRYLQQIGIIKDIFVNYVNKEQEQEEQQSFDYPKILLTRKYRYFNHSDHTDKLNGLSEPYEEGKYFPFSCGYPYDASFNRPTIRMHDLKLCITQWKKLCENKKTKQKGTHIPITLLWMGSKSKKSKTTKTKSVVYTGSYSSDYSTMGASQYWPNKS